ncbi:EamA family transporter RarD [bacterium]|nr:EamA family transporter RarD [bacterium]
MVDPFRWGPGASSSVSGIIISYNIYCRNTGYRRLASGAATDHRGAIPGPRRIDHPVPDSRSDIRGVAYGLGAFLWWGLSPVYFKAIGHVPPIEVLAHRIVWSLVLLVPLLAVRGRLGEAWRTVHQRRVVLALAVSTLLVATNWFTFVYSIATAQLVQASLGYFINPLVNVLLGMIVLRERLRPWQWVSLALATAGVVLLGLRLGEVPVISLVLAFSFGFYGLIRKTAVVGPTIGLTVETALLTPVALAAMWIWNGEGMLVFGHVDRTTDLLLALSGVITAVPLVLFAAGARRLRYATVGFLQYAAPSGQFLLAVLAFGEPMNPQRLVSFILIWIALAIYSADTVASRRRPRAPA